MKKTVMQIGAAVATAVIAVKTAHAVSALGSIDDVRVGPLLTTSWAQGDVGGAYCYNYYTPNHYVCGCVATAIAQIMYCHRYPTARIYPGETIYASVNQAGGNAGSWSVGTDGNGSYTLSSGGASTTFDPPYGGPYDWNLMVASPTSGTSENSRKAIGRLTRDAGLAVFADYNVTSGATSGFTRARASSLILNLHYADAVRTGFDANKLIANLDAGLPVLLALTSHEVVADGYGYHNGTLYIHINYGHGGTNSGWYDPTQKILDKNIDDMVANIFPPTRGARHSSIISGRVLNASGNPVANATVTAAGTTTATTTSNAKGIYSFILPAGSYTFTATSGGNSGTLSNCAVEASEQLTRAEVEDPYNDGRWDSGVNKSKSGVDVTIGKSVSENEPDSYLEYVESDSRQWVDLSGLTQTRDITFDADINWTSGGTLIGQNNYGQTLFTAIDGEICCKWYMYEDENGAHTGVRLPSGRHRFVVTGRNNAKLTVSVDGGTPIESAATSSRNDMGTTLSSSLYLFAKHFGGDSSAGDYSSAKLYSLKVYGADGVLAHYYVPALKNSVAGLYDRVNDKWYHSGSGTELIAGPALPPPSALTNPVTADYTLMSDVTINGTLTVNSGATICLNGYKLTVNGLAGDGTITDFMPAAACGELHVVVPSGTTAANSTVAFTGTMKLVVEGGGTFTASKASQSYTGGTVVSNSTTIAVGTVTHPFGNGNRGAQTITLKENAVYKNENRSTIQKSTDTCCYSFELYEGSRVQYVSFDSGDRRIWHFGTIVLHGNATFYGTGRAYLGGKFDGSNDATRNITLNGYTLTVDNPWASGNSIQVDRVATTDAGTISFVAGNLQVDTLLRDFSRSSVEFSGNTSLVLYQNKFWVSNLVYTVSSQNWTVYNSAKVQVYGRYRAGQYRPPILMMNGSTLDLSDLSGTWDASGTATGNNVSGKTGLVLIDSGAAVTVDVGTRNVAWGEKLVQFADGNSPASTVEFNLAGANVGDFGLAVVTEGGHTYLKVTGQVPYARWVIDNVTPANSGWRFYNPNTDAEMTGWTGGVTSEMEVRIYSCAEHQAVVQQGVSPLKYSLYGPFQIPNDVAEWDLTSCFDRLAGDATIDVNGKKLYLNKIDFAGTITDTSADTSHPGELHLVTAGGSVANSTVALAGNLRLIVEGGGTFTASKASQTYTGGTVVSNNTTIAAGTVTHPFGNGNATQTITLKENAVYNNQGNKNGETASGSTSCYNFELYEGSSMQFPSTDSGSRRIWHFGTIVLHGNATFYGTGRAYLGGKFDGSTEATRNITLNGYTLTVDNPWANGNSIQVDRVATTDAGTISFVAGNLQVDTLLRDFSRSSVEFSGNTSLVLYQNKFWVSNLVYTVSSQNWSVYNSAKVQVYGRYLAGQYRPPILMMNGSTLDLSGVSGTWDADGTATGHGVSGKTGLVLIDSGAAVTVDIGTRTVEPGDQLVSFPSSYAPDSSVTFTLAATGAAQTPAQQEIDVIYRDNGLFVKSTATPSYARYVVGTGWKYFKADGTDITSLWSGGVTADMEVRIHSYDEYVAVKAAGVSPSRFAICGTVEVPEGVTSLDMTTCFDILTENGAIDLKGKSVTISGFDGTGTIKDTSNGDPGELHVATAGRSIENSAITLTGNLRLVVEGGGTFTASKASQSYTGGTVVSSSTTLETRTRTQPFGNNSQTITLKENAVYSVALSDLPGTFQTSCRYNFVLYGGSAIQAGAFNQRRTPLFGTMELLGDASFSLADKAYFGGTSSSHSEITLYGHTLTVTASGGPNMGQVKTLDDGKVSFTAGSGIGMHEANSDFTTATVEYTGTGYAMLGDHGLSTGNLVYNTEKWSSHNVNAVLSVYGTYTAGTHRPPIEMKNGSTLDLSNCVGTLSATGTTSSNGGLVTSNGPLKFASGAAITVVLSGRTDLHTMAKSENPYIVTWASQPNTTFTLDAATGKEFKLEPDGTGIKLIRRDGLSIHLR